MASYLSQEQETQTDQLVVNAVEAAAKGENADQLLEVMLNNVAPEQREDLRRKFAAALKKRNLKQPQGNSDVPSHSALERLREALTVTAKQAFERVLMLIKSRPEIAVQVERAGKILTQSGVTVERIQIREADIANVTPGTAGLTQIRNEPERGA
jgi:hypothetical protein